MATPLVLHHIPEKKLTEGLAGAIAKLIRIACAGWSFRSARRSLFDERDSHFARYATRTVLVSDLRCRP